MNKKGQGQQPDTDMLFLPGCVKNKMPVSYGRFIVDAGDTGIYQKESRGILCMDYIDMVEKVREELLQTVNQRCDAIIRMYQNSGQGISTETETRECELAWISPAALKGKKPAGIKFATGETIETSTWKKIVQTILKHCNRQPDMHEKLMELRGKVFGRQRIILGKSPDEMDVPVKIDEGLYFEAKFDTEALITMMTKKVLEPAGYDYSGIKIRYTAKVPAISENEFITPHEGRSESDDMEQGGQMMQGM